MLFVRRLYLPLLLLLCALWSLVPLDGGDDFWAHAAIGRIFWETGHIPRSTVFLWSDNVPWVFHDYGSGILYALLLRVGGPWLALCLNFALAAIPLVLIWRHAKARAGEVPLLLVALFVPALWFCSVRWRLRPEGFTVLFLTLLLLFIAQEKRPKWQYAAVAGMFALWPNLHGGMIIGIMVLWVAALLESAGWLFKSGTAPEVEPSVFDPKPASPALLLALAAVCSLLPFVCNPWGWHYISIYAGTEATSNHIAEWRHFWAYPAMNMEVAWGVCILWSVAFAVWCLDCERRVALGGALLLLGALWIQARRQMWLTSVTSLVVLAQSAPLLGGERLYRALKRGREARLDGPMRLIAHVGVLVILVSACFVAAPSHGLRAVAKTTPVNMSRFLLSPAAPKGRTFNDYEYSAALEWFLHGKRLLYIDLINAYHPKVFDDWFLVAHGTPEGIKLLDTWKVDVVVLRPINERATDDPIYQFSRYIAKAPAWTLIYRGTDGRVWARKKRYNVIDAPPKGTG